MAWKVSHGVLYTADLSATCFCSAPMESIQHLFFYCPLAVSVLTWLQSLMFLASPLCPTILLRHVLFVVPRIFCYLLNICKFCIWVARNDFRFRGKRPSAVDVMEGVRSRVRFHLPLFFRRFRCDRLIIGCLIHHFIKSQHQVFSVCRTEFRIGQESADYFVA